MSKKFELTSNFKVFLGKRWGSPRKMRVLLRRPQ